MGILKTIHAAFETTSLEDRFNPLYRMPLVMKRMFDENSMAMCVLTQEFWIELVSIVILCALVCALLYYLRDFFSRKKELLGLTTSAENQNSLIDIGAGHLPSDAETGHLVMTDMVDNSAHVLEIRRFTKECKDVIYTERGRPAMHKTLGVIETIIAGAIEDTTACLWEPRRSIRIRKATRRFEESWYNGRLQRLGSAIGVHYSK